MNPEVSRPLTVEAVTEKVRMDAIIRLCDGAFPTPIAQRNTYPAMLDKLDRYGGKEIRDIMAGLPGWRRRGKERITIKPYGQQRYFEREVDA